MRQVGDMLVWLGVIMTLAAVVYFTPQFASYVSASRNGLGPITQEIRFNGRFYPVSSIANGPCSFIAPPDIAPAWLRACSSAKASPTCAIFREVSTPGKPRIFRWKNNAIRFDRSRAGTAQPRDAVLNAQQFYHA